MNTIVPIDFYTPLYYHVLLFLVLITFIHTQSNIINIRIVKIFGFTLFLFVLFYLSLRPVNGVYFGDMQTYADIFERYQEGSPITSIKDPLFHLFMFTSAKIMNVNSFFFICGTLYILPLYVVCKKWFLNYWFYGFFFLVGSFSFWVYGTNGIRNGIAGSFFLLAISREKQLFQILWLLLAVNFHTSILLPIIGFVLANFCNRPKHMIAFWVICIPLSLISGGLWENIFSNLGFGDERMSYLTQGNINNDNFSSTGFRWDFLLYSATAVFAGWYYIVKKNFSDKVYFWLFNTYVFCNAFWILIIRANFSNRFAYLSWFMMALVIIYPLLKQIILKRQYKKIGFILLSYFLFTYLMNVIIADI